jgi:hypothetical protein
VNPPTICSGGGAFTVNGMNFLPSAVVTLQATSLPTISSVSATVNGAGTQISTVMPGGLAAGTAYDVVVDNGAGTTDLPPHKKVTTTLGPSIITMSPDVVFNGISTRVLVFATSLGSSVMISIVPTGMTAPVTSLQSAQVAGHPGRFAAVVPQGQAPGDYDLLLSDSSGCSAILAHGLKVTGTQTLALKSVSPSFATIVRDTTITLLRDTSAPMTMAAPFVATPHVFLNVTNPPPLSVAIEIPSVTFVDSDTLTAVVPKNTTIQSYDLIVVNPDGTAGVLSNAFRVNGTLPPSISSVVPSSIVDTAGQVVTLTGQTFTGSTVTLSCADATGNPVSSPNVVSGADTCTAGTCTKTATIDGSPLAPGDVCVLRLTNGDLSYSDYSALGVTNASLNLSAPRPAPSLNVGRRALASAAAYASPTARFAYAIGGDPGASMANAPFSSTEVAPVDAFGKVGAWSLQPASTLRTARAFAATATLGRYLYVAGGTDGTSALTSAERAMILNPDEAPTAMLDDFVPATTGLDPGYWFYRVSATFGANDPDNPGGEGLPSSELIVKVPSYGGRKMQVAIAWTTPLDALGVPLPNIAGYNIYRTPMVNGVPGQEVLLSMVGPSPLRYVDDGTDTPGTQTVLPLGSTGHWAALPSMSVSRKGAAGAIGPDPATPGRFYFYALLGLSQANVAQTGYEYLPITVAANGHQTVGSAWTTGTSSTGAGRWQLGAWVADKTVSALLGSDTWIFMGGGMDASLAFVGAVDAGKISAGGDLGTLSATPKDFSASAAGYGVCAANGQLYTFGGAAGTPSSSAKAAALVAPAPSLANNSWNSEGLTLTTGRYLPGSAVAGPFIFLMGGQTSMPSNASTSTEVVVW